RPYAGGESRAVRVQRAGRSAGLCHANRSRNGDIALEILRARAHALRNRRIYRSWQLSVLQSRLKYRRQGKVAAAARVRRLTVGAATGAATVLPTTASVCAGFGWGLRLALLPSP